MQLQLAQLRACCARVVCARRAEWFCPSSMVVNLCGVCSQGRVVLSLVYGRQPVWCVLAGPSGFVPRPWSSTHRKRSWNSPKFATRPAWLPPMVGLLLLIFVVYVFSSAVHLRIENKTSMHNRHQFGVCLYCGRFRQFTYLYWHKITTYSGCKLQQISINF